MIRSCGTVGRVVDLVTALAALVRPGEMSNRNNEEAKGHQQVSTNGVR